MGEVLPELLCEGLRHMLRQAALGAADDGDHRHGHEHREQPIDNLCDSVLRGKREGEVGEWKMRPRRDFRNR